MEEMGEMGERGRWGEIENITQSPIP